MKTLTLDALPTNLSHAIGLCYFDPVSEELVEFNNEEKIYLTPYENTVRRYYLVVSNPIYNGSRLQQATISVSSESEHVHVRVLEGLELHDKYSFEGVDVNNSVTMFFNNHPTGIIPIDINTQSTTAKGIKFSINISIRAE